MKPLLTSLAVAQILAWSAVCFRTINLPLTTYAALGAYPWIIGLLMGRTLTESMPWTRWFACMNLGLAGLLVEKTLPGVKAKMWMRRVVWSIASLCAGALVSTPTLTLKQYAPQTIIMLECTGVSCAMLSIAGVWALVTSSKRHEAYTALIVAAYFATTFTVMAWYRWIYSPHRMPGEADVMWWRLLGMDHAGHLICLVGLIWMGRNKDVSR